MGMRQEKDEEGRWGGNMTRGEEGRLWREGGLGKICSSI